MNDTSYRVAIIGCGRMGQNYAEAYTTYPDTQIIAIVDANAHREMSSAHASVLMHSTQM